VGRHSRAGRGQHRVRCCSGRRCQYGGSQRQSRWRRWLLPRRQQAAMSPDQFGGYSNHRSEGDLVSTRFALFLVQRYQYCCADPQHTSLCQPSLVLCHASPQMIQQTSKGTPPRTTGSKTLRSVSQVSQQSGVAEQGFASRFSICHAIRLKLRHYLPWL